MIFFSYSHFFKNTNSNHFSRKITKIEERNGLEFFRKTTADPLTQHKVVDFIFSKNQRGFLRSTHNSKKLLPKILFFGCSFVFGDGVSDEETLPSQVARRVENYNVENLGLLGAGPNDIWRRFEKGEFNFLNSTVGETKQQNIAIYLHFAFHISRVAGSGKWLVHNPAQYDSPHYQLIKNELKFQGSHKESLGWKYHLYRILNQSSTLQYFNLGLPQIRREDIFTTVQLIESISQRLKKDFGVEKFIIVSFPAYNIMGTPALDILKTKGFKVLEISKDQMQKNVNGDLFIPLDGHPTAALQNYLAKRVVTAVKSL